jgi:HEAT repeat protein
MYANALKAISVAGMAMVVLVGCTRGVDGRISRAYALGRHPSDPNKNRIEALLHDRDRDVRVTALVVMATVDMDRARRLATIALADPDGLVRAAAVTLCGDGADVDSIRRLSTLAVGDPSWQVRARALDAIASSEDPVVREAFSHALSDTVRRVRRSALRAGVEHPGLLPADRLSDLVVSDPDWENRVEAARALGASKDPAAYAGLDAASADPNEFVRATAVRERRTLEIAGISRTVAASLLTDAGTAKPKLLNK